MQNTETKIESWFNMNCSQISRNCNPDNIQFKEIPGNKGEDVIQDMKVQIAYMNRFVKEDFIKIAPQLTEDMINKLKNINMNANDFSQLEDIDKLLNKDHSGHTAVVLYDCLIKYAKSLKII